MSSTVSRSEYVMRNVGATLAAQIVKNLLSFASRTVFIWVLGKEYLGVNSLFTEVLQVFSFAELGIGTAFVYSLYKPLAHDDTERLKSLMKLFAKAYRVIGLVIALMGLALLPFIKLLVGEVDMPDYELYAVYLLYVFNSAVSYLFTYKVSLITADQKNYVVVLATEVFHLVSVIVQVILLLTVGNYLLFMTISVVTTVGTNVYLSHRADKMYPYLKEKAYAPLSKEEKNKIFTDVKALAIYRIAGSALYGADSIFISLFINVVTVGIYSNYKLITNVFQAIGSNIVSSLTASVGNLNADASPERQEEVFNGLLCACAWYFGLTAVGMFLLINPLIELWIGADYCLDMTCVALICVMYYEIYMHNPCVVFRSATGVFVHGKYGPVVTAILDVILDIVLGILLGLPGIILATIISRLVAVEVVDPYVLYKRVFHSSPLRYLLRYFGYVLVSLAGCAVSWFVISLISVGGIVGFAIDAVLVTVCYCVVFFAVVLRTRDAQVLRQFAGRIASKFKVGKRA